MRNNLQTQSNDLYCYLLSSVETQTQSSDIATNKGNDKVIYNNSRDDIANTVSIRSGLYYALLRYVNQYIYQTAKLFCFVGRCRKYNSQFIGKYLQLGFVLVSNRPDNFRKQTQRGIQSC